MERRIIAKSKEEAIKIADEIIVNMDKKNIKIRFKLGFRERHNTILLADIRNGIAIEY